MEAYILQRSQHPISRKDIDPNVLKVLYRLLNAGHTAYLVGGSVRDLMLGVRPKDFDVATSAHPEEVRALFRNSRLIGRRFRLAHVFFREQNIEVATFRRLGPEQTSADHPIRHDNTFGSAEEDAFRRDFTINALFYDPRGFQVIDYSGGAADLRAGLIRSIGDPDVRICEDPVRMIRAVRLVTKLGFTIEPLTRAAIERHRAGLLRASPPRLVEEIYRTLALAHPDRALELMEQLGILEVILPFLSRHLRQATLPLGETGTARNLAALGRFTASGRAPGHGFILAALLLDLYLAQMRRPQRGDVRELLAELRARGFARGDTERMRLLLETFRRLLDRPARFRRMMKRPHFALAKAFYELMAPNYAGAVDLRTLAGAEGGAQGATAKPSPRRPQTVPAPSTQARERLVPASAID